MFIIVVIIGSRIDALVYRLIVEILVGVTIYAILNISFIKEQMKSFNLKKFKIH